MVASIRTLIQLHTVQWWLKEGSCQLCWGREVLLETPTLSCYHSELQNIWAKGLLHMGRSTQGLVYTSRWHSGNVDQGAAHVATSNPVLSTHGPIWTEVLSQPSAYPHWHNFCPYKGGLEVLSLSAEIENVFIVRKIGDRCWSKQVKGKLLPDPNITPRNPI